MNYFFNVVFFLYYGVFRRDDFLDKIGGFFFGKYSYMWLWLYILYFIWNFIWIVIWKDLFMNYLGDVLDYEI